MGALESHHAKSIMLEALDRDAIARAEYLDRACGGDDALRRRVAALLEAHLEAGSFLDDITVERPPADPGLNVGDSVGRYRILGHLGEGGFGSVYKAEQTEPVRRMVALKVIRVGMNTRTVVARFEQERQALAMMDHPNIACVFDAGATIDGRPYFVMEFVRGIPITDYCAKRTLSVTEKIELTIAICAAIQHAHQKGVIHRDLKPSNVLVSDVDGRVAPKVIDFGIAKATHARLTEKTICTAQGQLIGTPQYMSPEQAEMTELDIDTRTDIYSLGVMLYELLTGMTPISTERIRSASFRELTRMICDEEPARPASLNREIRGDLETIVLKALEKDRNDRYQSAGEFAADLRRFLNDEQIAARPPTVMYQIRKFARRNRGLFISASAVVAALAAAAGISTSMAIVASNARDEADSRAAQLEQEQSRTTKVVAFQQKMLRGMDFSSMGSQIIDVFLEAASAVVDQETIRELRSEVNGTDLAREIVDSQILERAGNAVSDEFSAEPAVSSELYASIADTYRSLGMPARGLPFMRRAHEAYVAAYGANHKDSLLAFSNIGVLLAECGRLDEAARYYHESHELAVNHLGPAHEVTLTTLNNLGWLAHAEGRANEAREIALECATRHREALGDDHPSTIIAVANAGIRENDAGRREQGTVLLREAASSAERVFGTDDPTTCAIQEALIASLRDLAAWDEVDRLCERLLTEMERKHGRSHPQTLSLLTTISSVREQQGRIDEMLALIYRAVAGYEEQFGPNHPETIAARTSLVFDLYSVRRLEEAEEIGRETLRVVESVYPRAHPARATLLNHLAIIADERDDAETAERLYREALDIRRAAYGPRDSIVAQALINLASILHQHDRLDESRELLLEAISIEEEKDGPGSTHLIDALRHLARVEQLSGNGDEAVAHCCRAIALCEQTGRVGYPDHLRLLHLMGAIIRDQHEWDRALATFQKAMNLASELYDETHPQCVTLRSEIAETMYHRGDYQEAIQEYDSLIALVEAGSVVVPVDVVAALYGERADVLIELGRFQAAEIDAVRSHDLRAGAFDAEHRSVIDSRERMQRLYKRWDEASPNDEVAARGAKWQNHGP